jgi:hypothetical protein
MPDQYVAISARDDTGPHPAPEVEQRELDPGLRVCVGQRVDRGISEGGNAAVAGVQRAAEQPKL